MSEFKDNDVRLAKNVHFKFKKNDQINGGSQPPKCICGNDADTIATHEEFGCFVWRCSKCVIVHHEVER